MESIWETHDQFDAGFDAALYGSNTTNCFFGLFGSRAAAAMWFDGHAAGKRAIKRWGGYWVRILVPSFTTPPQEPPPYDPHRRADGAGGRLMEGGE